MCACRIRPLVKQGAQSRDIVGFDEVVVEVEEEIGRAHAVDQAIAVADPTLAFRVADDLYARIESGTSFAKVSRAIRTKIDADMDCDVGLGLRLGVVKRSFDEGFGLPCRNADRATRRYHFRVPEGAPISGSETYSTSSKFWSESTSRRELALA